MPGDPVGLVTRIAPVTAKSLDPQRFTELVTVNYLGVVNVLAAVLPPMLSGGYGHIAVIASVAGYRGLPLASAYGPTKAAVINLCESLAPELAGHGVRLQLVNPGFVDTPMQRAGFSPAAQAYIDSTPLARQADPSEVASTAVFLSSAHASFVTGAIMNVSGGGWMG